jgi:phosphoglycolate phosphatase-like HAD superfamily hydrolase
VVTGKGNTTTGYTLKKWGLIDYFDAIETGSDDGPVKPRLIKKVLRRWNVPADSVAYLGDAPTDIDAAREAGIIPLVAAWAESTRVEPLVAMEPEAVFYSVEEFAGWVEASASDQ